MNFPMKTLAITLAVCFSDLCASFGDALLELKRGARFSNYIPNILWNLLERNLGLPAMARHLIIQNQSTESSSRPLSGLDQVLDTILELLDVSKEDFLPIMPFTSFGLDSLGATKVSTALRPYVSISQMQLLGGISWDKVLKQANKAR